MTVWSLKRLLASVGAEVERQLTDARSLIAHEGEKGGASEEVWRSLLRKHLPLRYQVDTGFVVDSEDKFSEQIDVIIFDRQYSPLVFELGTRKIFPAESVYAVFEAKQSANAFNVGAAKRKASTVRNLMRTSLPIRDLDGRTKKLQPILAGILALDSDWKPAFGKPFRNALETDVVSERLDVGCVASHGVIKPGTAGPEAQLCSNAATVFLFDLVARLQEVGTVPMLDMTAYSRHL